MLEIRDLHKSHGALRILDGVSLDLGPGDALGLRGESGSGKSTLLHLVAGLDHPDRGSIQFAGQNIARLDDNARAELRRARMGIVFQQFNLVGSLTVGANVALQARLAGRHEPQRVARLVERLGIADLAPRYPEEISGGQQQRVAIARALAVGPDLILADEPTGNLDEETGDSVMTLMLETVAEAGAALIFVTHSARLADRLPRVLTLRAGHLA